MLPPAQLVAFQFTGLKKPKRSRGARTGAAPASRDVDWERACPCGHGRAKMDATDW